MNTTGILVMVLFGAMIAVYFIMRGSRKEDDSSNLVVGDAYKAKESDRVIKNNHVIHTIYRYDGHADVWACPNCEAESSGGRSGGPVCPSSDESGGG